MKIGKSTNKPLYLTNLKLSTTIAGPVAAAATDEINICFDAHFDLVTIHPFNDGNGCTSRLLKNYLQLYFGLSMGIAFKEDKVAYFEALQETLKQEDITVFKKFMYAQYEKYLLPEIEKFEAMKKDHGKSGGYSFVL